MSRHKTKFNNRDRYLDKFELGPSIFWDEEDMIHLKWHDRHRFRLQHAVDHIERLNGLAAFYGFEFFVNPDLPNNHHFQFRDPQTKLTYHWYPSSAKFVIEPMWKNGIHVHDFLQAFNLIMEFRKESAKSPTNFQINLRRK